MLRFPKLAHVYDNSDGEYQAKKSCKKHDVNIQQVQDTVDQLKAKHGSKFTQIRFHIWAELVFGRMCSMDAPPSNNSMFNRAGDGTSKKK